jgi:hypothetical protein
LTEEAPAPVAPTEAPSDGAELPEVAPDVATAPSRTPEYWLRVHGFPPIPLHNFPFELNKEVVYYNDFFDPRVGRLPGDPRLHLHEGDVLIYYADGGAVVYAVATVAGDVEGPLPDTRRGQKWLVPIKREAMIRTVTKAPHAVALEPPSGWHFLRAVRDYTYIRLPDGDGPYLVEQVRSRASARE